MIKFRKINRILAMSVAFVLISLVYLVSLGVIQIVGTDEEEETDTTIRLVTVQAMRGTIYDRNGVALVKNEYTYDLSLSFSAVLSLSPYRVLLTYSSLLNALEECNMQDKHVESYFPFDGAYPNYTWKAEAKDGESTIYYRLERILSDQGMESGADLDTVLNHYLDEYELLMTNANGERIYDDTMVDKLIHLLYDLEAKRFLKGNDYVFVSDVSMEFMSYVKELGLSGVVFTVNATRVYTYPGYASHILGEVGPIYSEEWDYYNEKGYQMNAIVGKSGCELAFESYLHGIDGTMLIEEDSEGNVVSAVMKKEPVAGNDVYLTIDINLQIASEDGLAENAEYVRSVSGGSAEKGSGCNAGAAVVMDPTTFDILAIASYPTYDLTTLNENYNDLLADDAIPLMNRAINGLYAPGSTIKPGIAITALTEGVVTATEEVFCSGNYPNQWTSGNISCANNARHGSLNIIGGIANSCNTFFCEMGNRLGIETMEKYMTLFGFGQETGLELGGATGWMAGPTYRASVRSTEAWTIGNTWQASIGQSDTSVSPLQICCYISTLSNGGTRYSAHLLSRVVSYQTGEVIYEYTTTEENILSTVDFSKEDQTTVLKGMMAVVAENSTITRLMKPSLLPDNIKVGGKTGTAQNSTECDNALFVCNAGEETTDDCFTPEITIAVVLEKGYSGGYASLTAGNILRAYYGIEE